MGEQWVHGAIRVAIIYRYVMNTVGEGNRITSFLLLCRSHPQTIIMIDILDITI